MVEGFPSRSEDGALIIAEVLRDQLNALNDDIQNRATPAELDNAEAVQIEIQNCATHEEMNKLATAAGDALDKRPTFDQVDAMVTGAPAGTSAKSNAVAVLSMTAAPEYDPSGFQRVIDKLDDLIQALRRGGGDGGAPGPCVQWVRAW